MEDWINTSVPEAKNMILVEDPFESASSRRFRAVCKGTTPLLMCGTKAIIEQMLNEQPVPSYEASRTDLDAPILKIASEMKALKAGQAEKDMPAAERSKVVALRARLNELRTEKAKPYCEGLIYRNEFGRPCIPKVVLRACLREAGCQLKLDKYFSVSSANGTFIDTFLRLDGVSYELQGGGEWVVDVRPGKNPDTKEKHLLHRPRFDDWAITVEMTVTSALIPVEDKLVRQIFDIAGSQRGLGAFRPGLFGKQRAAAERERAKGNRLFPPGHFGRFVVSEWTKID